MRRTDDPTPLWNEYERSGRSEGSRNALVERYLPLVVFHATKIHVKLPSEVEVDDLITAGVFGLVESIERFDRSRGVFFETFLGPRVRGAIFDELRDMDWAPRLVRSRAVKLERANRDFVQATGHEPTREELERHLKLPAAQVDRIVRDGQAAGVVSLNRKWFETDSNKDVREIDSLEDRRGQEPMREMLRRDLREFVSRGFNRIERFIIGAYYFEGMTMKQVGRAIDLSESRVSQLHASIVSRLKAKMTEHSREHDLAAA